MTSTHRRGGVEDVVGSALCGFVLGIGLLICSASTFYEGGYKQGQIDALTDNVKYELVQQPNGELHWQEIKDE